MTPKEEAYKIYKDVNQYILPEENDLDKTISKAISLVVAEKCFQSAIAVFLMYEINSDIEVQIVDFWEEVKKEITHI